MKRNQMKIEKVNNDYENYDGNDVGDANSTFLLIMMIIMVMIMIMR